MITVLTCSYNRAPYIKACADSVLAQSVTDWEWLIHDDGSTDGTYEYLASLNDPRIRVRKGIHRGYDGVIDAHNELLQQAKGEWIVSIDSDDVWMPQRLAHQLKGLENTDAILSHGDIWLINSQGDFKRQLKPHAQRRILNNDPIGSATINALQKLNFPCFAQTSMIKRSILLQVGGYIKGPALWDFSTFLEMSLLGRFNYVPEPIACWRRHGSQETMSAEKNLKNYNAHYEHAAAFLKRNEAQLAAWGFDVSSLPEQQRAFARKANDMEPLVRALNFLDISEWSQARQIYWDYVKHMSLASFGARAKAFTFVFLGLSSSYLHVNFLRALFNLKMKCESR